MRLFFLLLLMESGNVIDGIKDIVDCFLGPCPPVTVNSDPEIETTTTTSTITTTSLPIWLQYCYNKTDDKFYPVAVDPSSKKTGAIDRSSLKYLSYLQDDIEKSMAENPCDATITPTTSTTAITEVSLINADLENGTVTPGDETTPTENTTSSEEVSTTTMVEPMYQSYPCRPSPGYNDLRLDFGNGTILEYNITKPLPNTYFSYPPCKKTKPPTGSNSSTTSVEIPSTTSTVSTSSTTSTTSSTTSSSTATTSTTSKITIEDDTASTSSSLGTTITRPTKEPKVQKTSSTSLGTEATGTSGTRATDSSFGTSETSTTAPNEDSETTGTTPFVKSSTDIHEESGSTETNWIETESETTSKESTWIDRRRDSSGKGDGDQSATLTTATGTVSNTTTDGKTAGTTSTTPGPNGTVSTTLPPLPTVTETESKTSTSSAPPLTGTNSTTSTTSTTTTPGHSSPTSNTATVTESTKVSSASNGTTPITGTSEGAGSTGVTTESGSDESGSTGTETTWTPHSTDSNDDGTFPTHLPSHDSTPKEGKNKTSPSSTTTTGHSTGTTSPGHGNVTGSTVTPAANATSPSSTTSTSMNAVSSTTSPVDVTETGSPSPDSSSNSPDPSSSSNPSSTVPGNVSTTLPSQNTTSGSSPVPGSSPSSSPSNASPSSSPASVPASTSPLTSNSSSTTPGVQNATNVPTMTKQPTSTSSGPTAPPGSAGKILWETAVSYPNCSVLLTSTLAYSNGTKANVTKWVDIGCGRRWETTVSNNMINQEGAIVVSQVGQAYDDCTVDVSQLFKYPNGSVFNMTTTYASDCTTLEPENSSPTSTGSASTTPSPIAGKEKILGTSARAFPNCTVVITTTVQYPNKTIANTSKSVDQKCGGSFDTGVKDVILSDGTKIRSERGTVYDNCTLLIQQELEYVNGTQGTKDNWLGDPCVPTTSSPSTTAIPSTTPTAHPSEPSGTTQEGPATTPKIIKVTAKIIGVKATSLPNCTVVITQTMQYSNGTIEDIVKTVDQKCGGNFTVDYSDQNLTLPDGGRLLSSTGSSYGNCSLAVTNKIQYPNNTMTNPTTWYNDSCDAMTSEASTTGLPTSKPIASTNSGTTSTNPAQTPAQSPGATTVPPKVDTSSGTPSSSPTSALSSASTGSVGSDSLSSTTSGSTPTPSTAIPQCSLNSFLNDSANTILVNGTNMTHTCKSGYTFPDGAPMKMSECVNGVWKGQTNATCQPNSCPPLTINLKNARIPQGQDSVMTSQQPIGTMVVHSCSARHVFPSGEPMRIYDCVAGGIWKGKINSDECQHVEL